MTAILEINRSFSIPNRNLFVIAGTIVEGFVRSGIEIHIPLDNGLTIGFLIIGVEFLRTGDGELIALTIDLEGRGDIGFLEQFDIKGETAVIADAAYT